MPYISNEALFGAGLLVVLALAYQYIPKTETPGGGSKKKKNKKKGGAKDVQPGVGTGQEAAGATAKLGDGSRKGKGEGKSTKSESAAGKAGENGHAPQTSMKASTTNAPTSFAEAAKQPPKQKTLAEKLAPKEPKTKVDDMIAPEDRPGSYARVMSIKDASSSASTSTPPPLPVKGTETDEKVSKFQEDYAESSSGGEEEDEWDVVQTKKKKPISLSIGNSTTAKLTSTSLPLPTETKVQRKNAKKAEAKKAARAAEEEERKRRLAMHKRDLEKERINDIYGKKKGGTGGNTAGAGSKATLDGNGKLIWD